jgi:ubiquinol-cytochrome c reductase cytochrome c subunit
LLAGTLAVAVVGTVAGAVTPTSSAAPGGGVTEAARGGQLFLTSCAACHGTQGAGTANGPDIRNAGAALADFMLSTGRMPLADPGAPARRGTPVFSVADRQAIVAYVASLGQGPAIPNVVTSGADLSAGRDVFVSNCAACHGPAGGGGSVGGGFVAPALTQADATTIGEAVVSGPGPMPRFSFSPSQLDNLAGYVEYLRNAPHPGGASSPEVGPVTEGFVAGLTLLALLAVARWVAVRQETDEATGAAMVTTGPDESATSGEGHA